MPSNAKKLQKTIRWYSISAVILTGFVIASAVFLPLETRIFDMQKVHVAYSRDASILLISNQLSVMRSAAKKISDQMTAHPMFDDQDQLFLKKKLQSDLSLTPGLLSIIRLNAENNILVSVGEKIPVKPILSQYYKKNLENVHSTLFLDQNHIVLIMPVSNPNQIAKNTDIFVFSVSYFSRSLSEMISSETSFALIYYFENKKIHWIKISHGKVGDVQSLLEKNPDIEIGLADSIEKNKSDSIVSYLQERGMVISYASVPNSTMGVLEYSDANHLYSAIMHLIFILVSFVLLILLFFVIGLSVILHPLSGRLLLYSSELETLVEKKQEELRQANKHLYDLATYDSLTHLLSRSAFYDRAERELSRCKRHQCRAFLFFIDLNSFKKVNDEHGHAAGDYLLKTFGKIILESIRKEDFAGRMGGDEFAILFSDDDAHFLAQEVMDRMKASCKDLIFYEGNWLKIDFSVGMAIYPDEAKTVDTLLKTADRRMYENKLLGSDHR